MAPARLAGLKRIFSETRMSRRVSPLAFVVTLLFVVPVGAEGILAPGAKLETISTLFKFTEGPAADAEGNVYFTDQPNDRILKWSAADGKVDTFMKPCGRSNGLCCDRERNLFACEDAHHALWSIGGKTTR